MHPLQGIVCYLAKLFSGLPRLLESPLRVTPHSSQPQAALRKPQKASEVSKAAQSERKQAPGREALSISTLQQVAGPASGRNGGGGRSPLQIGGRAPPSTTATSSRPAPPRRQAAGHAPALGAPPREQAGPGRRASFRRPSGPGPRPAPARAAGPASRGQSSKRTPGPPDPRPQNSGPPRPRRRH